MITERVKKLNWEKLTGYQQHMALMYLYRLATDPANLEAYIETVRYRELKLRREDIPLAILTAAPERLKQLAYGAIGESL
jgi:hypothetical protein